MRNRRRAQPAGACVLAVAVLAGCSAGVDPESASPAPQITHGEPEEVLAALEARGTPCEDAKEATVFAFEHAARCVFDGEPVLIVHFFDEQQGRDYQAFRREQDQHGVFAPGYGIETETVGTAEHLSRLLPGSTFG